MSRTARQRKLRLLHLEDSAEDHDLLLRALQQSGALRRAEVRRVDSEASFRSALTERWDAIISDYNLPGFSGLVALDLLKASGRAVPFILVSGQIGEETAVEAMRNGASDYLLKNTLARLAPALEPAIRASEDRSARAASDLALAESRERVRLPPTSS